MAGVARRRYFRSVVRSPFDLAHPLLHSLPLPCALLVTCCGPEAKATSMWYVHMPP